MKTHAIILSLFLLLPLIPAMAQEQDDFEAIPMTYQKKNPSFNGGDANDFSKWVNEHKHYPEEAKKAGIQGRVVVGFTIDEKGRMTDVKVVKGVHPLLDKEALRVIKSAPKKWTAGTRNGKSFAFKYTIAVGFGTTGI